VKTMRTTIKRSLLCVVSALALGLVFFASQASGGTRNAIRTDTAKNTLETARFFLKQARYAKAIVYYDILLTRFKDSNREAA